MLDIIRSYKNIRKNKKSMDLYKDYYLSARSNIIELLNYYKSNKKFNIAIWGAGLKGCAFLQIIDYGQVYISTVFDVDQKKVGIILATGHKVEDYNKIAKKSIDVVLLMNGNYETEVAGILKEAELDAILINIDSVIDGALTVSELLAIQAKKPAIRKVQDTVAAAVIMYNCGMECIANIESFSNQVGTVFVYDNSTRKNINLINLLQSKKNIEYIDGNGNQGISAAMNQAAQAAIKRGYKWLITFDQDSFAEKDMIELMYDYADHCEFLETVGILCPSVKKLNFKFNVPSTEISFVKWIQQSGSMLNLKAFQSIGGFDEALFIDQVDYEYCVRLLQHNYKIIKVNKAVLLHNISDDNIIFIRKKGRPLYINKNSPMRYYYNTRNILYCTRKYKNINKQYWESQRRNLGSLLMTLPYEKEKTKRVRAVVLGYIDYCLGKMGETKRHF